MTQEGHRRNLGNFGEAVAAGFLIKNGYTIIARQWRCPLGEIDLVAQDGATLVFVEVRTRQSTTHGSPEESLTPAKQARLVALAHSYCEAGQIAADTEWRIDVIAITVSTNGQVERLTHIPSAIEG